MGKTTGKNPRIAMVVALCDFPFWEQCVKNQMELADEVYIRFDGTKGDPEILRDIDRVCGKKIKDVVTTQEPWRCPEWREECLRMLDESKPDMVFVLDEDEQFPEGFKDELTAFWKSDKQAMMLNYSPLVTDDNRVVNGNYPYPPDPHMKVFKWRPELSYFPYHGDAKIAKYVNPNLWWRAESKLEHLACFTKGLEETKTWRSHIPQKKAVKAVTLLGFGPSSSQKDIEIRGEVWSLNNCYEAFPIDVMKLVTRIYEMHKFEKRRDELMKNNRTHFANLNDLGKLGHMIVMQDFTTEIANSVRYPLQDIEDRFNERHLWGGTGAYMLAHAIYSGYTDIWIYGFDQMDFEHIPQRESMTGWIQRGKGMGVKFGGALTYQIRHHRRYGFDWGPEMDEQAHKEFWAGWPFEIKFKDIPRAQRGDLYGHD